MILKCMFPKENSKKPELGAYYSFFLLLVLQSVSKNLFQIQKGDTKSNAVLIVQVSFLSHPQNQTFVFPYTKAPDSLQSLALQAHPWKQCSRALWGSHTHTETRMYSLNTLQSFLFFTLFLSFFGAVCHGSRGRASACGSSPRIHTECTGSEASPQSQQMASLLERQLH